MTWWIWLVLGLVLLAGEMLTPGAFYFMFLGISAGIVGLLSVAFPAITEPAQWILFSIVAVVSLVFFRRPLMQKFQLPPKTGHKVDSLVGQTAIALDDLGVGAVGKAELRGAAWSARNVGDRPVTKSERCKVERVDGLTLDIRNE